MKHSAAAGHFILVCASRRFALFIIYAREWDGRPPQCEFIPTTAEQSSSELSQPSKPCDGEFHTDSPQSRSAGEQQLLALAWTTALDRHHPL